MCARQTIERRGSQFAQDRKRSSQDHQHGWSKENVREKWQVFSRSSVVAPIPFFQAALLSLSLHSSLISIRTFNQNSTQNSIFKKKKKKKQSDFGVCVK